MSSFFSIPGEKKRKRAAADGGPKKRIAAASKTSSGGGKTGKPGARHGPAANQKNGPRRNGTSSGLKNGNAKGGRQRDAQNRQSSKNNNADEDEDESISGSDSESDYGARPGPADMGDSDGGAGGSLSEEDDDSDLEGAETAAELRRRLAERHLNNVAREVATESGDMYAFDAEEVDRDLIAERLQEDVAEAKGRVYRRLAGELAFGSAGHCQLRWNAKNVNAVAVCAPYAYTVSSDAYLTKWRIQELPSAQAAAHAEKWAAQQQQKKKNNKGKKAKAEATKPGPPARRKPERVVYRRGRPDQRGDASFRGHVGAILTVAASQDGQFVVTGGADGRVVVWEAAGLTVVRVFTHHRDAVTGLVFRRGTNQVYSCSKDRTIKIWSLDELAYVQTLFGHQDEVADIDALAAEKCVSAGARDRTARLWKVVEETQLVFRGVGGAGDRSREPWAAHEGSLDRVALLDDELFVTGSDNGALALWSTQKKKPLHVVARAHGVEPAPAEASRADYDGAFLPGGSRADLPPPPPQPRWITALRAVPYADVVLSGSWDGCVRVWRLSADKRKLEPVCALGADTEYSIHGVINDIALFERGERGRDGLCAVAVFGQQHRLGRWGRLPGARNGAVVFEVPRTAKAAEADTNGVDVADDEE